MPTASPDGQLLLPLNRPENEPIPDSHRSRCIDLLRKMLLRAIEETPNPEKNDER